MQNTQIFDKKFQRKSFNKLSNRVKAITNDDGTIHIDQKMQLDSILVINKKGEVGFGIKKPIKLQK